MPDNFRCMAVLVDQFFTIRNQLVEIDMTRNPRRTSRFKLISKHIPPLAPLLVAFSIALPNDGRAAQSQPVIATVALEAPGQTPRDKATALTRRGEETTQAQVPDYVAAVADFREAASLGGNRAKLRLGELMVLGRGTSRDAGGGLKLIREAADAGDGNAFLLLGDFYARGTAGPGRGSEAIAAYEAAAKLGRSLALVRLGQIYQDGKLVAANPQKAVDAYLAAAASDRPGALVPLGKALAEGRFPAYGKPADGINLLQQADAKGVEEAAVTLSDCYLNGTGVRKSPAKAIALLRKAAEAGNLQAGRRLVALYRDGRKHLVRRNRKAAIAQFASLRDRLDTHSQKVESLLLLAAATASRTGYRDVQSRLLDLRPADRPATVRKLRSVNANAYVYVVQSRLGSLGLYGGNATGTLSAATLRAINRFCREREARGTCRAGPLTIGVTELIATAF